MAHIDVAAARLSVPVQRPRTAPVAQPVPEDEPASSTSAMRRTNSQQGLLIQALTMSDDLSALVSSLRRNRSRDADESPVNAHAWLEQVLDPKGPEKLSALRLQLQQFPPADVEQLRNLLGALFADPSDAVAALRALRSGAELEELAEILDELEQEFLGGSSGKAVRAGLNVALKARLHSRLLDATPAQLRQTYRDFLGDGEPLTSYEEWIALYGFESRTRVVDFIEHAMGADMYALDPSCSRLEFGYLLQRVRQLTMLRSADYLLLACCWEASVMIRIGVTQSALLSALFAMIRRGGGLQELFDGVFGQVACALQTNEKSRFAANMRRFLKAVPHGLWSDPGQHVRALDEVEGLLEAALRQEQHQAAAGRWVAV